MKFSVAQLNYRIGDFERNSKLICDAIRKAKDEGSELVIFSELCIPGYPPLDLLDRYSFIEQCNKAVEKIAHECTGIAAIVGSPTLNDNPSGKKLFNSALVLSEGKVIFRANKALLPTYDIFDEYRYFEPERNFSIFEYRGTRIAVTICEDLWDEQSFDNEFEKSKLYNISPGDELFRQKPDLLVNISASPFSYTKIEAKENIFRAKSRKYGVPVVTVNQTGANTELIFEGASIITGNNGEVADRLPFFEESLRTYTFEDIIAGKKWIWMRPGTESLMYKALVTGVKDYFQKTGFTKAILGLSGGIDSALCTCIATDALGRENVRVVLMPSRYSTDHSVSDSIDLVKRLDIHHDIIKIEKPFKAFEEVMAPVFAGREPDVTEENIQARTRAVILMALSNKFGCVLLNTSNKSEAAVGYGTLYGDMAGGLSVIGDVYKTDIYRLAAYINREREIIPLNIIRKAPSAELRPGQFDTDSLPDYGTLDSILYRYIELQKTPEAIIGEGADRKSVERVIRMINSNEYKRYQAPPMLRISSKAFGSGRRMPLAAKY